MESPACLDHVSCICTWLYKAHEPLLARLAVVMVRTGAQLSARRMSMWYASSASGELSARRVPYGQSLWLAKGRATLFQ